MKAPSRIALDELEDTYSKSTAVLFVLSPKEGDVFTPNKLTAIAEMTEEAWQLENAIRVDSIANFNTSRAEDDDIIVAPLYDANQIKSHKVGLYWLVKHANGHWCHHVEGY